MKEIELRAKVTCFFFNIYIYIYIYIYMFNIFNMTFPDMQECHTRFHIKRDVKTEVGNCDFFFKPKS